MFPIFAFSLSFKARLLAIAAVTLGFGAVAVGQNKLSQDRQFEVASIRPNNSGPSMGGRIAPFVYSPNGRFTATNVTLIELIMWVYPIRRIQIEGGPGWIDVDRFDVAAKADDGDGDIKNKDWLRMVQTLLEDRFKLSVHRETREMGVYALVPGKTQAKLPESKDDEQTTVKSGGNGRIVFQKMPMWGLVSTLGNILRLPVLDDTGMKGFFDFTLDPLASGTASDPADPPKPVTADAYADFVVSAVQEQLGLRLERRKAPVEITIIDHVEKPSDN